MTISHPLSCPPWWSDLAEHESDEFRSDARSAALNALEHVLRKIPDEAVVREWHRRTFHRVVPLQYYAGNYRQDDPARPCLGRDLEVADRPAVAFPQVLAAIAHLFRETNAAITRLELSWQTLSPQERAKHLAVIVGSSVARFVHIHPFLNGNGRISRVLWMVLLHRFGLPPQVSAIRRPGPPYGDLMAAAMTGDYLPTIAAVLRGLAASPTLPV